MKIITLTIAITALSLLLISCRDSDVTADTTEPPIIETTVPDMPIAPPDHHWWDRSVVPDNYPITNDERFAFETEYSEYPTDFEYIRVIFTNTSEEHFYDTDQLFALFKLSGDEWEFVGQNNHTLSVMMPLHVGDNYLIFIVNSNHENFGDSSPDGIWVDGLELGIYRIVTFLPLLPSQVIDDPDYIGWTYAEFTIVE